jgi:acetyl/propionyl-CoA carboxylase alpha subunit
MIIFDITLKEDGVDSNNKLSYSDLFNNNGDGQTIRFDPDLTKLICFGKERKEFMRKKT